MKEKIKAISWYQWAIMIIAGVLISGFLSIHPMIPWHAALGITTERAIEMFGSGESTGEYYAYLRGMALAGFILFFIIAPALLFHYFLSDNVQTEESKPDPVKSFSLWTGMILMIGGFVTVAGTAVVYPIVFENTKETAEISAHKDDLRAEMAELSLQAAEYLLLPEEKGGGEGSFEHFNIEDLPFYPELEHVRFVTASVESDTLLTITGVGSKPGKDETFENADGSIGNIQLQSTVTPSRFVRWEDIN